MCHENLVGNENGEIIEVGKTKERDKDCVGRNKDRNRRSEDRKCQS